VFLSVQNATDITDIITNNSFDFMTEMEKHFIADLCKLNRFHVGTAGSIPLTLVPVYIGLDDPVSA